MEIFALLWTEIIIRPMLNTLIVLYVVFFQNMAIAILVFTVIIRFITLPLTLKQLRQMRKMTELQPKMKDVQTKYAGDRTRISQETMKVYRDAGVSPVGCLGPLIIQMPILIGLFRVLIQILYTTPDDLIGYSERVYSWITFIPVHQAVPINAQFLWLDLGAPDPSPIIIPFLVAATTFLQQKMTTTPSADPRQQSSQAMMLWMIPIMLGFFSLQFPAGLSMYWIVSNLIGVGIQYFITGWQPLFPLFPKRATANPTTNNNTRPRQQSNRQNNNSSEVNDGNSRTQRPHSRRSRRTRPDGTKRRPNRGRSRNH